MNEICFMRLLVINLSEDTARLKKCQSNLRLHGFPPEIITRIDAIKDTNGFIGCALSHLKALDYALKQSPEEFIIIIEDDFRFTISFENLKKILHSMMQVNSNWFVWQLYASRYITKKIGHLQLYDKQFDIVNILEATSGAAFLIRKSRAHILRERFFASVDILTQNRQHYSSKKLMISHRTRFSNDEIWKELQAKGYFIGLKLEIGRIEGGFSHTMGVNRSYENQTLPEFLGMGIKLQDIPINI